MSGPPENISAAALWAQIKKLPRPYKIVDFPRVLPGTKESIGKVAIQVLVYDEQMAAQLSAEDFARKSLKEAPKKHEENLGYENVYNNAASIEVLYRACKDPDDITKAFFPSPSEMRKELSLDEIGALVTQYQIVQAELGPQSQYMSKDVMDAWVTRLVEGGNASPLAFLSSAAIADLVMHMASHIYNLRTATSLPGTQPEPSSSSTTPTAEVPA